jgi:hypothetical protein
MVWPHGAPTESPIHRGPTLNREFVLCSLFSFSVGSNSVSLFLGLASQISIQFVMDSIAICESVCLNFSPTLHSLIVNFRSQIRSEKA